jgi:AcrR family transcriptional regulator
MPSTKHPSKHQSPNSSNVPSILPSLRSSAVRSGTEDLESGEDGHTGPIQTAEDGQKGKLKRVRSPRGQGANLRSEILDAIDTLMSGGSDETVSIRAVGEIVGVTAPSIYRHFADKEEMVHAACERGFDRFDAYLRGASAGHKDPLDAIHAIAIAYLHFAEANRGQYRVLFMAAHEMDLSDHDFSFDASRTDMSALVHLAELVDAGIVAGKISPFAGSMHVAAMLWTMVHGIASLRIAKHELPWPSIEDQAQMLFTVLSHGICPLHKP